MKWLLATSIIAIIALQIVPDSYGIGVNIGVLLVVCILSLIVYVVRTFIFVPAQLKKRRKK